MPESFAGDDESFSGMYLFIFAQMSYFGNGWLCYGFAVNGHLLLRASEASLVSDRATHKYPSHGSSLSISPPRSSSPPTTTIPPLNSPSVAASYNAWQARPFCG